LSARVRYASFPRKREPRAAGEALALDPRLRGGDGERKPLSRRRVLTAAALVPLLLAVPPALLPGWAQPFNPMLMSPGAAGYSAQVQQFFDRLLTLPDSARRALYAALIDGLVADGIWALLDFLYLYAAADSATSLINLPNGTIAGTLTSGGGAPVFVADRGWTGGGINTNVQTNFNPTSFAGNYTQNDAALFWWSRTASSTSGQPWIGDSGPTRAYYWNNADHSTDWALNTGANNTFTPAATDGLFILERTASNAEAIYRNGTQLAAAASASTAVPNSSIAMPFGPMQLAAAGGGKSLSAGDKTALNNRLLTYLQALGAA
jgi:hypothetical protein